jgi:hypothetical protein
MRLIFTCIVCVTKQRATTRKTPTSSSMRSTVVATMRRIVNAGQQIAIATAGRHVGRERRRLVVDKRTLTIVVTASNASANTHEGRFISYTLAPST